MKNKYAFGVVALAVIILLSTIYNWPAIADRIGVYTHIRQQEHLARELGVKIQDDPDPEYFPLGYFGSVLKPGMSLDEVHKILMGYKRVVNCFGTVELYDYFSTDNDDTLRFMVVYDQNGRFDGLELDSPYDRTLGVEGCYDGLLSK